MVVDGRFTRLGAYRKMVARIREDCFETDVDDFKEACKLNHLGMAWFHLVTDENRDQFDVDTEWYVSLEKISSYPVWCYWG